MRRLKGKINIGNIDVSSTLFYAGYFLFSLFSTFSHSMVFDLEGMPRIINYGRNLGVLLILSRYLFINRLNIVKLIISIIGVAISFAVYLNMNAGLPLIIILVTLSSFQCDANRLTNLYLYSTGFVVLLSTILSNMGIIVDRIFTRTDIGTIRHSFGMIYATVWAGYVSMLVIVYIYKQRRIGPFRLLAIAAISLYVYLMTDARLQTMVILVSLGISFLRPAIEERYANPALAIFMKYSVIIAAAIAFFLQWLYSTNPEMYSGLDLFLSKRLSITQQTINQNGFHLLGKDFLMQGFGTRNFDWSYGYNFVDSFYINYAIKYGVLYIIFVCIYFSHMCKSIYSKNTVWLLLNLAIVCITGIFNSTILLPNYQPFFVLLCIQYSLPRNNANIKVVNSSDS